jgi:hypothetical protein
LQLVHASLFAAAATLGLLTRFIQLAAAKPADHGRRLLAPPLCLCWASAIQLAYPQTTNPSSSSSSSGGGSGGGGNHMWIDVPQLRQAVPAVAALMHWLLQQPQQVNPFKGHNEMLLAALMQQVHQLVEAAAAAATAAAAAGQGQCATSSNSEPQGNKQGKHGHKTQLQQGRGQAGVQAGLDTSQTWELYLPQAAREQVRSELA